jgi:hypothetical protein
LLLLEVVQVLEKMAVTVLWVEEVQEVTEILLLAKHQVEIVVLKQHYHVLVAIIQLQLVLVLQEIQAVIIMVVIQYLGLSHP